MPHSQVQIFPILSDQGYLRYHDSAIFGSSKLDLFICWKISAKGYLGDIMARYPSFQETDELGTWERTFKTVARLGVIGEE